MTESVKTIAGLIITKDEAVCPDGTSGARVLITQTDGTFIIETTFAKESEHDDFTEAKALIAAWLGMGLFTPLADRTESLADHGLSRSSFMVSPKGIEIARGYRELTGKDITEAI